MKKLAQKLNRAEEGAAMLEYALMIALIAIVCVGAVSLFGTSVLGLFEAIENAFP